MDRRQLRARTMRTFRYLIGFLVFGFMFGLLFETFADVGNQTADTAARDSLLPWIEAEVKAKNIPSLSIALVDDQRVVFAASVGNADPQKKLAATPNTPYRVGSVSKPFTALL